MTAEQLKCVVSRAVYPVLHNQSDHPQLCLCRSEGGQQVPHAGRPPLGRAPSTPPQERGPPYPLTRQPGSATSDNLSARRMANININRHLSAALCSPEHLALGPHPSLTPAPTPQPDQAFQRPHSSETLPSCMHSAAPTAHPEPWPATSTSPAQPTFCLSPQLQPASGGVPLQHVHSTEPSLEALAAPRSHRGSPQLAAGYTSSSQPSPPMSGSQPGPVAGSGGSMTDSLSFAPGGSGVMGSRAYSTRGAGAGSEAQSGRSSLPAASSAASWVHSQSAQQLTANVKQLAAQVGGGYVLQHAVTATSLFCGSSYCPLCDVFFADCHADLMCQAAVCTLLHMLCIQM